MRRMRKFNFACFFMLCIIVVVLLLSATSAETRPLRNYKYKSKISFPGLNQGSKATLVHHRYYEVPTRVSPGGPDPRHH
ncbi:hypothetical protein GBA52_012979 [Prunus armeniaca]|nr:hypothetical protein GBA52_012979 [Prunus armeniaca]